MSEREVTILNNPRARPRPTLSCLECKRKKLKCDREQPCGQCVKSRRVDLCQYAANSELAEAQQRHATLDSNGTLDDRPSKRQRLDLDLDAIQAIRDLQRRVSALEQRESGEPRLDSPSLEPTEQHGSSLEEVDGVYGRQSTKRDERRLVVKEDGRRTRLETGVKYLVRRDFPEGLELLLEVARSDDAPFAEVRQVQTMQKRAFASIYQKGNSVIASSIEPLLTMIDTIPVVEHSGPLLDLYFDQWSSASGMGILRREDIEEVWQQCSSDWKAPDAQPTAPLLTGIIALAQACIATETDISANVHGLHKVGGATATDRCELLRRYLTTISRKRLLSLETMQIHMLLLQTEELLSHPPDLLWQSLGSVLRTAWSIGLHVDVSRHPGFTEKQRNHRLQLWHAIHDMDSRLAKACNLPATAHMQGTSWPLKERQDPSSTSDPINKILRNFNLYVEQSYEPGLLRQVRLHIFLARHRYEVMEAIAAAYKRNNDLDREAPCALLGLASSCGVLGGNIKDVLFLAAAQPGLDKASMLASIVNILSTAREALRSRGFDVDPHLATLASHDAGVNSELAIDGFDGAFLDFFDIDGFEFDSNWPTIEQQTI